MIFKQLDYDISAVGEGEQVKRKLLNFSKANNLYEEGVYKCSILVKLARV